MFTLYLIAKGIVLGFAVAAPVGPVGVICLNRTLEKGRLAGLVSGLGAATADFLYAVVAAFGLTSISHFLTHYIMPIRAIGGIILLYIAISLFITHTKGKKDDPVHNKSFVDYYLSTFFITLTNPAGLFAFLILFSNFATMAVRHFYVNTAILVISVFIGSTLWWLFITWVSSAVKPWLGMAVIETINKVAAVLIGVLGLIALWGVRF